MTRHKEKKSELSEEDEEWIDKFLKISYITYRTPGWRDTVYIEIYGGKREYKQKQYLLRKLRDLLRIITGSKIITN